MTRGRPPKNKWARTKEDNPKLLWLAWMEDGKPETIGTDSRYRNILLKHLRQILGET